MTRTVRTTCPYCGVGCGVLASRSPDGAVTIKGDPQHPANFGRLCSKGAALGETIGPEGRLLYPQIDGRRATWNEALDHVATSFAELIRRHGPDSVAFYVSGQLLTEDYYVANKLMKGFIGSANIDTNSRLCMASSVAGHKRAFGADVVPGNYEDLEKADLIVYAGSNAAWCHPILHQRILAAREKNPRHRLVVVDPRRTSTCDGADLHLAITPGSDVMLFNGLLVYLAQAGVLDETFIADHTNGFDDALKAARDSATDLTAVAEGCGVPVEALARFYRWFAETERTVTLYSQGVNQSSSGTDKVNAILNCHLATGRIGRPGMGPFSLTGQPNAMGGREVGGLANQLAAHMDFAKADHRRLVAEFWQTATLARQPGLKAVDMFRAVGEGHIKAIWIMSTNPVVSLPDAGSVAAALKSCELVVVSDCMEKTDTTAYANVLLPAAAWGEKDGSVTNSERRISRQRAFQTAPGEAKPDWWMMAEVARRMGFGAQFSYASVADVFREHAALSGFANDGDRAFDISPLASLEDADYGALEPIQWPVAAANRPGRERLYGDGRFTTIDGRARFVAVTPRPTAHAPDPDYPFILNTGRVRDHWHTMTRTGLSPRLSSHRDEPFVALHPEDIASLGLKPNGLAELESRWGRMIGRVMSDDGQRRGNAFAPMHWNAQFTGLGVADAVVNPATDPVSGQPELKHTPVSIRPFATGWQALVLARLDLGAAPSDYWARARGGGFWRYHLAGAEAPASWDDWARTWLGLPDVEWGVFRDPASGRYRFAAYEGDRLLAFLIISESKADVDAAWIGDLFRKESVDALSRIAILAGRQPPGTRAAGATVCACLSVGKVQIEAAVRSGKCRSVEAIGQATGAGTNCGSCKPELAAILAACGEELVPGE